MGIITLYHGSSNIIKEPKYGEAKKKNDFGIGFYTTTNIERAKEWACYWDVDGYANKYELKTDNLKIINLQKSPYTLLNWIGTILKYRKPKSLSGKPLAVCDFLIEKYAVKEIEEVDVICGYRADDSYFYFAKRFVTDQLALDDLEQAMRKGNLGEQLVLKSQKAFEQICFQKAIKARKDIYYDKYINREQEATRQVKELTNKGYDSNLTYASNIYDNGGVDDDGKKKRKHTRNFGLNHKAKI